VQKSQNDAVTDGQIDPICFMKFKGEIMVRKSDNTLAEPIFHEPVFNEGVATHDPTGFIVDHPSDTKVYKQIEALLKTKVVGFAKSRKGPSELYSLAEALGARGAKVAAAIKASKRIVFHAIGDSGATTGGKQYSDELGIYQSIDHGLQCHARGQSPGLSLPTG
jgi:hypothetical protein